MVAANSEALLKKDKVLTLFILFLYLIIHLATYNVHFMCLSIPRPTNWTIHRGLPTKIQSISFPLPAAHSACLGQLQRVVISHEAICKISVILYQIKDKENLYDRCVARMVRMRNKGYLFLGREAV
jgi:hypothetical protein